MSLIISNLRGIPPAAFKFPLDDGPVYPGTLMQLTNFANQTEVYQPVAPPEFIPLLIVAVEPEGESIDYQYIVPNGVHLVVPRRGDIVQLRMAPSITINLNDPVTPVIDGPLSGGLIGISADKTRSIGYARETKTSGAVVPYDLIQVMVA